MTRPAQALTTPSQDLAAGFAQHVEQWSRAHGAATDIARQAARAAEALSLAMADGHVCVRLRDIPDMAESRMTLLASGVVGTPEAPAAMPMVIDVEDRLYLHRHFDYERRLARRLTLACRGEPPLQKRADALPRLKARLAELFSGNAHRLGDEADWQKLATALALRGRLTIISGGPGTGKTTTLVNLLACLIELEPDCRFALAAPTGKAAARMTEAIRQRASHLGEDIRRRLPTASSTVHRLLGVSSGPGGFVHHAGNRLPIDALVVDEASMLDLALATQLLEAVPDSARIVLLGDKDQLAAVEAGAVFSELSVDASLSPACIDELAMLADTPRARIQAPPPARPSALRDAVVWFTQNFRFASDSGIGRLAWLVNQGLSAPALAWLRTQADPAVRWIAEPAASPSSEALQGMLAGYAAFIEALRRDPGDLATVWEAYAQFRVLCAVREGPRGVLALNDALARRLRLALEPHGDKTLPDWYCGRPVQVLRNDPVQRLFNGDIGITLPDADGALMVHFPLAEGGFRAVPTVRLPQVETAFAMTVHKAQGSEFAAVWVMLPEQRSRVLTRELLYTAVTRARLGVTIDGSADVLAAAVSTTTQRHSGLLARLRECAPPDSSPEP
jgi:exodeoxyribonuclease V alpha subunit